MRHPQKLAGDLGCHFWLEAKAQLTPDFKVEERAYVAKVPADDQEARLTLRVNPTAEAEANVSRFEFSHDGEAPNTVGSFGRMSTETHDVQTATPEATVKPEGSVAGPGAPAKKRKVGALRAAGDAARAQALATAALNDASWFLKASAETRVCELGGIPRARDVINVLGTGSRYDGRYRIAAVTHTLTGTEHQLKLQLERNALG